MNVLGNGRHAHAHALCTALELRVLRGLDQCRPRHEAGKGKCWTTLGRLRSTKNITGTCISTSLTLNMKMTAWSVVYSYRIRTHDGHGMHVDYTLL